MLANGPNPARQWHLTWSIGGSDAVFFDHDDHGEGLRDARWWFQRFFSFLSPIWGNHPNGLLLFFRCVGKNPPTRMAFTYPYPKLHTTPVVTREHFTFGLCECCNWDPAAPSREIMRDRRIPCCSCLCQPIRWADTASSSKTGFMSFWTAALLAVVMNALCSVSFFISAGIFIIVATIHRQQIRRIYGMPHGTCPSFTEDLCTWLWCSCCATMQEAMEIEYIDPPAKPWQQTMMESFIPSALQTHPSTPTGTGNRQERTACCWGARFHPTDVTPIHGDGHKNATGLGVSGGGSSVWVGMG